MHSLVILHVHRGGNWSNWTNWTALRNILPLCGWNLLDQRMHWTTAGGASDDLSRSQSDNKKSKVITDIKGVLIKDKKTVKIGLVLMFTEAVEESKVWK